MKDILRNIWNITEQLRDTMDFDSSNNLSLALQALKFFNEVQNSQFPRHDVTIPPEASWDYLISETGEEIVSKVYRAFTSFEKQNEFLENAFSRLTSEPLTDAKNSSTVSIIIKNLSGGDDFADIDFREYLDYFLFDPEVSSLKSKGVYFPQNYIYKLLQEFIPDPDKEAISIYNPFAGLASLAFNLPENAFYYGQESNDIIWAWAKIRLFVNGQNEKKVLKCQNGVRNWGQVVNQGRADIAEEEYSQKFDFIVSIPPFGKLNTHSLSDNTITEQSSTEDFVIEKTIEALTDKGKAALIVPLSTLYRNGRGKELRKQLIKKDILEYVISLPGGAFLDTNTRTALIVLNKAKVNKEIIGMGNIDKESLDENAINKINENPRLIDALKKINNSLVYGEFNNKDIESNDFILTPIRYLIAEENKIDLSAATKLDEILDFIRPYREDNPVGKKIGIKELSDNPDYFRLPHESILPKVSNEKTRLASLSQKCLLVATKGNKIKPSFFEGKTDATFYSSSNIFAFKVNENKVRIDYLIPELHKEYVQNQLKKFWMGSGVPTLRKKDFLSVRIFLPSLKAQEEIVKKERQDRFQSRLKELGFEKEIEKLKKERDEDLRSKKHNILQHMANVKNSAEVLIQFMKNRGGALNANDVISQSRGLTVETRFSRLLESINDSIHYITNITNDVEFEDIEQVSLADIVKDCIEKGRQGDNYKIQFKHDELSFSEGETEPVVEISVKDFAEVYNNILENAILHGFKDKKRNYYLFLIELFFDSFDRKVVLRFSNNGKPFPKGMKERYGIKGEKAGPTGNKGFGSWKVKQFAENWGAQVNVFDQPEEKFPVIIEMKFNPVENKS